MMILMILGIGIHPSENLNTRKVQGWVPHFHGTMAFGRMSENDVACELGDNSFSLKRKVHDFDDPRLWHRSIIKSTYKESIRRGPSFPWRFGTWQDVVNIGRVELIRK